MPVGQAEPREPRRPSASQDLTLLIVLVLVFAVSVIAAVPFIGILVYGDLNVFMAVLAWTMTVPVAGFLIVALRESRRHPGRPSSFAPGWLVASSIILTLSALAVSSLDLAGAALAFFLVPAGVMFLVLSWVQPSQTSPIDVLTTLMLGFVLLVLVVWFAGRADEYLFEALISGAGTFGVIGALVLLRRRGRAVRAQHGT